MVLELSSALFAGEVITGALGTTVSIVKDLDAGLWSLLPPLSTARTSNVCAPWLNAAGVCGDVHGPNAAASKRHWNVEPASLDVKENDGGLTLVGPVGPAVIVVSGSPVSDRPRARGGRRVGVAGGVGGADLEGVRALREAGVARGAGAERGAVERALEGRVGLGGGERERGAGAVRPSRSARR